MRNARDAELDYMKKQNDMEVEKSQQLSKIETEKFQKMVEAIGAGTIKEMATAGPAYQVSFVCKLKLLSL